MSQAVRESDFVELARRVDELEARLAALDAARALREAGPTYQVSHIRQGQEGVFVPAYVFEDAGLTPQEMLVELALYLFDKEVLTLGQTKSLADMSMADFMQLLGNRGVNMHYDVEEFEQDIETLKRTGLWK